MTTPAPTPTPAPVPTPLTSTPTHYDHTISNIDSNIKLNAKFVHFNDNMYYNFVSSNTYSHTHSNTNIYPSTINNTYCNHANLSFYSDTYPYTNTDYNYQPLQFLLIATSIKDCNYYQRLQ